MSRFVFFALLVGAAAALLLVPSAAGAAGPEAGGVQTAKAAPAGAVAPDARHGERWSRAELKALRSIDEDGQARVAELLRRMKGLPEGAEHRALERQVVEAKLDARLKFLAARAQICRAHGDPAAAAEAEQAALQLKSPPRPKADRGLVQTRDKEGAL